MNTQSQTNHVPAAVNALTFLELVELFKRLNGGTAGFDTGKYKKAELIAVAAHWLANGVDESVMDATANAILNERNAAASIKAMPLPRIATQPAAPMPPAPQPVAPQPLYQPDQAPVVHNAPQPAQPDDVRASILAAINTTPAAQPAAGTVDAFLAAQAAQQTAPTNAPQPAAAPAETDEAAAIAAALAETARTHPATNAAQPAATNAAPPAGREFARELFKDLPLAIVNAIPATLTVPVFNHPQAEKPSADYRWTAALLVPCLIAMASSPTQRVWFGGPAATGKTEMARQLAARTGRAIFRVNFDRYTEASGIVGDMGLVNGNTVWVDGPVAAACRHEGAVLLLDELTYGTPGAISCLNPVLERNGTPLRLPRTGETLPVPDSLLIIVADNTFGTGDSSGEYHARNEIGLDTRSRFQFKLLFDYLPVADERAILRASVYKETGRKPSAAALAPLMQILTVSRAQASQGELQGAPSLRGAVAFAALLAHGVAPAEAFAITVVNGAPAESHEALRQIFAAHWPTDATGSLSAFSLFE